MYKLHIIYQSPIHIKGEYHFFIIQGKWYLAHIEGYTERDIPGYIFFVYNGASVAWIIIVNNFQFFANIKETM